MRATPRTSPTRPPVGPHSPRQVRYVKLGEGGRWEQVCLDRGIIRMGFGAGHSERFQLCEGGQWSVLTDAFIANGRDKGTATRFTNELRLFFEDGGETLWITFIGESLYWGYVDPTSPAPHRDGDGVYRTIRDGWSRVDVGGEVLTKDKLSGALCKLASYRGTSCAVDVAEYVVRRLNGQKLPIVERAVTAAHEMKAATVGLLRLLTPTDFELLVDLVFSTSGWRRVGAVGKTQKTLDLDITLPSTGERAFVQVKSHTNSAELADYIRRFDELRGSHSRMFFVHHTGTAVTDDARISVIGPDQIAELVMDAGLVTWLIRKVS